MRLYSTSDLYRCFAAAERRLAEHAEVLVIGGAALALGYGVERSTVDVDVLGPVPEHLCRALNAAREDTGLAVPVAPVTVAEFPEDFEDRLVSVYFDVGMLVLLVPERHDLALSKATRGIGRDYAALADLHARHPLDEETLLYRFEREMGAAIGDPRRLAWNVANLIGHLFGDEVYARARGRLNLMTRKG